MKKSIITSAIIAAMIACTPVAAEDPAPNLSALDNLSREDLIAIRDYIDALLEGADGTAAAPAEQADPTAMGIWGVGSFVDEFGEKTGEVYVGTYQAIEGTYDSVSATDGKCFMAPLISDKSVAFKINIYNVMDIKGADPNGSPYTVTVLDKDGEKHAMTGSIAYGDDRVTLDQQFNQQLIDILKAGGEVKILLEYTGLVPASYLFDIEDAAGFDAAYESAFGQEAAGNAES